MSSVSLRGEERRGSEKRGGEGRAAGFQFPRSVPASFQTLFIFSCH